MRVRKILSNLRQKELSKLIILFFFPLESFPVIAR